MELFIVWKGGWYPTHTHTLSLSLSLSFSLSLSLSLLFSLLYISPVGWGCRINWLHLFSRVRLFQQASFLVMKLNNLMVKFHKLWWRFGECSILSLPSLPGLLWLGEVAPDMVLAQSAGAVGYTDCISTEGYESLTSVLDMTLNNMMVGLQ